MPNTFSDKPDIPASPVGPGTNRFPDEHDFIRNPKDSFAIYQLKNDESTAVLRFESMNSLKRIAQQMRNDVLRAVENSEGRPFPTRAEAEAYLRCEGFSVTPQDDPALIEVLNDAGMEAKVFLRYESNCCRIDGYDTRFLDQPVRKTNYSMIYTASLPDECMDMKSQDAVCESIYTRFNIDRPDDFHGHSLSVSDIVVLKQNGQINAYYTDNIGFKKLSDFLSPENPLRNAEMSLEDDYGMIDGIINNGKKDISMEIPSLPEAGDHALKAGKARRRDMPER